MPMDVEKTTSNTFFKLLPMCSPVVIHCLQLYSLSYCQHAGKCTGLKFHGYLQFWSGQLYGLLEMISGKL